MKIEWRRWHGFYGAVVFLMLLSGASSAENSTGTAVAEVRKSLWDELKLTVFSFSYGPGVGFSSTYQPNGSGQRLGPLALVNQVTLAVPLFGSMQAQATTTISLQPWEEASFLLRDPSFGIQGDVLVDPSFSYWARYEVVLPLSEASRAKEILLTPQAINVFGTEIVGTPWQFQAVAVPQLILYRNGLVRPSVYLSPRAFYVLDRSWRLVAIGEVAYLRRPEGNVFSLIEDYPPTLGLGFRYTHPSGRFWVQPFLNFFPFGENDPSTVHPALVMNVQLK